MAVDVFNFSVWVDDTFDLGVKVVDSKTQLAVGLIDFTSIVVEFYPDDLNEVTAATSIDSNGYILFKIPSTLTQLPAVIPTRIRGIINSSTRRTLAAGYVQVAALT